MPSLSRSISEHFRDYIVGTRDNTAHEDARKIRRTRRGKKAHMLRLVNQMNHHISKRLRKETLFSLKLDLEKAVYQLEDINQALFELNPAYNEPDYWMETTLAPVYDCFYNIEMYYAERAMLEAKLLKEVDEISVREPLKSSKENVDIILSHENSKSDAPVVQTSDVQILLPPVHQSIEIGISPVMQLPITTIENKVHDTTSTSNLTTVPPTSCTTPKVPVTHPRTVTTVTDSISLTSVTCYKLPSSPDQISTPAKQTLLGGAGLYPIKPCRTWNKSVHRLPQTPLGEARLYPMKSHPT